jgi:hypothetical protein
MQTEIAHFEIAKLNLAPGDIVVVKSDLHLTKDQTNYIDAMIRQHIPEGCEVMVLGGGLDIAVLKKGER